MIKHSKSQNKPSNFKNINQNDTMQQINYDNREVNKTLVITETLARTSK